MTSRTNAACEELDRIQLSATPFPYTRKVRIALHEKVMPFTLKNEVPWNSTSETPKLKPLEQLPVLATCTNHRQWRHGL